jgi:hypothetical protein
MMTVSEHNPLLWSSAALEHCDAEGTILIILDKLIDMQAEFIGQHGYESLYHNERIAHVRARLTVVKCSQRE